MGNVENLRVGGALERTWGSLEPAQTPPWHRAAAPTRASPRVSHCRSALPIVPSLTEVVNAALATKRLCKAQGPMGLVA